MIHKKLFYIFSFFILTTNYIHSQAYNKNYSFLNPNYKFISISFQFESNTIIIPFKINNSTTLKLILDTGVRVPIITELPNKDSLLLNYVREENIYGLGEGKPIQAYYSQGNSYSLNVVKWENLNTLVLLEDVFELSKELGTKVHGLIGYDIFKDLIVEINYEKKTIKFHNPDKYKYRKNKNSVSYPLEIKNLKPYIKTTITQDDGSEVEVKLLIDTGASLALWLSLQTNDKLKLPEKYIHSYIGKGLNGDIFGKNGRIKKINIGHYEINNPITSFPDSNAIIKKTYNIEGRNGSIGSEILRRFKLIIDYPNNKITFIPNSYFNHPFYLNMSGITINNPIPGFPIYIISNIRKGSPADIAGIMENDVLISINHQPAKNLTLNDIHLIFQSGDEKKIKIMVLRNGKKIKTMFFLKKDI